MTPDEINILESLDRILRPMIELKLARGLSIHLPHYLPQAEHFASKFDKPLVDYVNTLLDSAIELKKRELKRRGVPDNYGPLHLFREAFGDEQCARDEWSAVCHRVSECSPQVLLYCEKVLREQGEKVPERPHMVQKYLIAAE